MHINFTHFKSEISLMNYFDTEDKCKAAIAQERWGDGAVVCPYCGCTHTYMTKVLSSNVYLLPLVYYALVY